MLIEKELETGITTKLADTLNEQGSQLELTNEDRDSASKEKEIEITELEQITSATPVHIHEVNVQFLEKNPQPGKSDQPSKPATEILEKTLETKTAEIENKEPESQNKINTERLIAELCLRCPNEQIKKDIQLYEYGKGTDHIRKKLTAVLNENLANLLVFLYNGKINRKIPTLKKDLVHDIIDRIQNLLPDICSLCNKEYKLDFDESPILPCAHCNQSSHKECIVNLINTKSFTGPVDHPRRTNQCADQSFQHPRCPLSV